MGASRACSLVTCFVFIFIINNFNVMLETLLPSDWEPGFGANLPGELLVPAWWNSYEHCKACILVPET